MNKKEAFLLLPNEIVFAKDSQEGCFNAGHDAGYQARDEKVCEWKWIKNTLRYVTDCACFGSSHIGPYCTYCGGKIKEIR